MPENKDDAFYMLHDLAEEYLNRGLQISISKTECMATSGQKTLGSSLLSNLPVKLKSNSILYMGRLGMVNHKVT